MKTPKLNKNGKILLAALGFAVMVDWLRDWRWTKKILAVFTIAEDGNENT